MWRAYQALSTCRPLGFGGAGPIPWTAADRYLTVNGYAGDDYVDAMELLQVMDGVYLKHSAEPDKKSGDG